MGKLTRQAEGGKDRNKCVHDTFVLRWWHLIIQSYVLI